MLAPPRCGGDAGASGGRCAPAAQPGPRADDLAALSRQPGGMQAALQRGEAQLQALAGGDATAGANADEVWLHGLLSDAHRFVVDLERHPPAEPRALDDAQVAATVVLRFCAAWLRLAAGGGCVEGAAGLRGPAATELVWSILVSALSSASGLASALLLAFSDLGGLALLGSALSRVDPSSLVAGMRTLRLVASRYRTLLHPSAGGGVAGAAIGDGAEGTSVDRLASEASEFRAALVQRLDDLAVRPGRLLRVPHFKELAADLGGVLGGAVPSARAFEEGCALSLRLGAALSAHCPGVPEADALDAMEWTALVLRGLLEQPPDIKWRGPHFPAIHTWLKDCDVWGTLVWRAGGRTQHHTHHLFAALLSRRVLAPCDLVAELGGRGALAPSAVPASGRLALQGALVATAMTLDAEATLDFVGDLCSTLGFSHLTEESVDLMTRLTKAAVCAGYDPVGCIEDDTGLARSLAILHFLRFMHWGYRLDHPPLDLLAFVRRSLLHSLLPNPAFAPLLPAVIAEALALAASPLAGASATSGARCAGELCALAVDAACMAGATCVAAEEVHRVTALAAARLCGALPPVGAEAWAAALADALACLLALPGAQIAAPQVGVLWSRLVVRPIFGLPAGAAALQYFKVAFLAQPAARAALLAPLLATPSPPPEVRLAHASIFCPASFETDPPPLLAGFFLPEVMRHRACQSVDCEDKDAAPATCQESPPRPPRPLRHALGAGPDAWDLDPACEAEDGDETAVAAAAAAMGVALPDTSAAVPRLRLDRVQAVLPEQGAVLLGELTAYDAVERRLWDEFEERGVVDDAEAVQQRDAAAARCLAALDRECDRAGAAGRELPAPLTEARAKFSRLCELLAAGAAPGAALPGGAAGAAPLDAVERLGHRLCERRAAVARADDALVAAKAAHLRRAARSRRRGGAAPAPAAGVAAARAAAARARVELVAELREAAGRAALGFVEAFGSRGFAAALRAACGGHGDPMLQRLERHSPWSQAQGEPDDDEASQDGAADSEAHEAQADTGAELAQRTDDALARPEGLSGYTEIRRIGTSSVHAARWRGVRVALRLHPDGGAASCQRELRALRVLRHPGVQRLRGRFEAGGATYLELAWCGGGTLESWCAKHMPDRGASDADSFVRCLGFFRRVCGAIAYVHSRGAAHGGLSLARVLLDADHRPVLADFRRCVLRAAAAARGAPGRAGGEARGVVRGGDVRRDSDYVAPEFLEAGERPTPSQPGDMYALGAMMAKAFLGVQLDLAGCPYDDARGRRRLPDQELDVDVADLLQSLLAQSPTARPRAGAAAEHRALDPVHSLRRRGLLGAAAARRAGAAPGPSPGENLLRAAGRLRDAFRGCRVDEPLMFAREAVFDTIANSRVGDWSEEALLGEWRVVLDGESGVDGGGLRREVVSLFFEQLERSELVVRACAEVGLPATLFVADRQRADKSPQQWRRMWTAIGAMLLRSIVHFGNAPVALSSAVLDAALGRLGRLPPDLDDDGGQVGDGGVRQLERLREARGDEWARSELLDLLRRVGRAEPHKEAGYRWMLAQRSWGDSGDFGSEAGGDAGDGGRAVCTIGPESLETIAAMLERPSYRFLLMNSSSRSDGSIVCCGAVLEWALLWDVYLKYIGGGDRWLAYQSLVDGLTARGLRGDLWASLTGEQIAEAFEGAALTPDAVAANLEFKPTYGYDKHIGIFQRVLQDFSHEELSMFLRFATGIGKLPANQRFPAGQKLTIRFLPSELDRLPSAHTCFWVVDVPPYECDAEMAQKLRQAIAAPQPFALS